MLLYGFQTFENIFIEIFINSLIKTDLVTGIMHNLILMYPNLIFNIKHHI